MTTARNPSSSPIISSVSLMSTCGRATSSRTSSWVGKMVHHDCGPPGSGPRRRCRRVQLTPGSRSRPPARWDQGRPRPRRPGPARATGVVGVDAALYAVDRPLPREGATPDDHLRQAGAESAPGPAGGNVESTWSGGSANCGARHAGRAVWSASTRPGRSVTRRRQCGRGCRQCWRVVKPVAAAPSTAARPRVAAGTSVPHRPPRRPAGRPSARPRRGREPLAETVGRARRRRARPEPLGRRRGATIATSTVAGKRGVAGPGEPHRAPPARREGGHAPPRQVSV